MAKEVSSTFPYLQTAYDTSFRPGDEGCKYPVSDSRNACGRIVWRRKQAALILIFSLPIIQASVQGTNDVSTLFRIVEVLGKRIVCRKK